MKKTIGKMTIFVFLLLSIYEMNVFKWVNLRKDPSFLLSLPWKTYFYNNFTLNESMKKKKIIPCLRFACISILLCIGVLQASAQFGKLVGNVVKSAANAMVGSPEEIEASKKKGNGDDAKTKKKGGTKDKSSASEDHEPGAGPWRSVPIVAIDFKGFCWECTSPSYDGIFCVKVESKPGKVYRFFRTRDGEQITKSDWKALQEPHFNKGVCAVRSSSSRRWYILKSNGDSIALDAKIVGVSNFFDGVAIAGTSSEKFFINDKGQRIYPGVKPTTYQNYPLMGGTRRLFEASEGKGYLDAHGKIVIKPQYSYASNFNDDYAFVYDMMGTSDKYLLINRMGKKVCEIPSRYILGSWSKSLAISDFVNGGAVAQNQETGKYDIVDAQMHVMASFDEASPFCLKSMPSTAGVCVVMNKDWPYPKFCTASGRVIDTYNNPAVLLKRPTDPFIEVANKKGEKRIIKPTVFDELRINPEEAWVKPCWMYTGYSHINNSLTTDTGYIMDYEGIIRPFNGKYVQYDPFSADGFAKATMQSTKEWRRLGLTGGWAESLEDHMVFVDTQGTVLVEIVDMTK